LYFFAGFRPNIDAEGELIGVVDGGEALLDQLVQIIGHEADDGLRLHVLDGADARERAVAAGRRQQRDIVADALIAVGPAQNETTPQQAAGYLVASSE
jgi:hypothetical protein